MACREDIEEYRKKRLALEIRLHMLENNGRNDDSPGVIRKIKRKLRNIK